MAGTSFTAVAADHSGHAVYVGIKDGKTGEELSSSLIRVDPSTLKSESVKLPKETRTARLSRFFPPKSSFLS